MPRTPRASVPPRTRSRTAVARVRRSTPVSRVVVRKPVTARVEAVVPVRQVEEIIDPTEALIRKHAPVRAARASSSFPFGYAFATAFVILLVVFGWWVTLDRNLQAQRSTVDPTTPGVTDIIQGGMTQFQNQPSLPTPVIPTPPPAHVPSSFEQRLNNAQNP